MSYHCQVCVCYLHTKKSFTFNFRYVQRFRSESKLRSEAAYYYTQMVCICTYFSNSSYVCHALSRASIQDGWLTCPSHHFLAKSTKSLGHLFPQVPGITCTAHSSYSQSIEDGWLACPSPHLLTKSTKDLGHVSFSYPLIGTQKLISEVCM